MGAIKNMNGEAAVKTEKQAGSKKTLTPEQTLAKIVRLDRLQRLKCVETGTAAAELDRQIASGQLPDGPTTVDPNGLDDIFREFETRTGLLPET